MDLLIVIACLRTIDIASCQRSKEVPEVDLITVEDDRRDIAEIAFQAVVKRNPRPEEELLERREVLFLAAQDGKVRVSDSPQMRILISVLQIVDEEGGVVHLLFDVCDDGDRFRLPSVIDSAFLSTVDDAVNAVFSRGERIKVRFLIIAELLRGVRKVDVPMILRHIP